MRYKDHKNIVWTRSEDGTKISSSNGIIITGVKEMTSEYMISLIYPDDESFFITEII